MDISSVSLDGKRITPEVPPDALAYVLTTSGSTGTPKAVRLEHQAVVNYVEAARRTFGYSPCDRVLQFASLNFDTAGEEIYPAIASGATVVLRTNAMIAHPEAFLERCEQLGITVLILPTSFWHHIVACLNQGMK